MRAATLIFSLGSLVLRPAGPLAAQEDPRLRATIERLTPDDFVAHVERSIPPPAGLHPFDEGMHTLSAAGEVTLIDDKRTMLSLHGLAIEARRETQRLFALRRR